MNVPFNIIKWCILDTLDEGRGTDLWLQSKQGDVRPPPHPVIGALIELTWASLPLNSTGEPLRAHRR